MTRHPYLLYWVLASILLWNAIWWVLLWPVNPMPAHVWPQWWLLMEAGFKVSLVFGTLMGVGSEWLHAPQRAFRARDAELDAMERRPLKPFSYR